jgi:hypothetical protein
MPTPAAAKTTIHDPVFPARVSSARAAVTSEANTWEPTNNLRRSRRSAAFPLRGVSSKVPPN